VDADLVVPVPDSGTPAAIGFSQAAGLPFELGIIRNHYVGRTFIQPTDSIRHMGVKLKHNANRRSLEGKRVVLVDDSIVRGTTSPEDRADGARRRCASEVHMRIASPPTRASCFYGVDTPETSKLLASRMSVEEMADFIKVDSLGVPVDRRALPGRRRGWAQHGGSRSSATPASPRTIRPGCWTTRAPTMCASFRSWRSGPDQVETSLRPTMPATIRPMQASRSAWAGSPNSQMPRMAVPIVPMPVQIA
jgi:hypothetical protein